MKENLNYKEFRKLYQNNNLFAYPLSDHYAYLFSPGFSIYFIKKRFRPNTVTVMMIVSGLIGACLFMYPHWNAKILGVVFIHVWYILDASDGEVARIRKKFSMYGQEIDYTAHVINHPFFILSFIANTANINDKYIPALSFFLIIELIKRNILTLRVIAKLKEEKNTVPFQACPLSFMKIIKYILINICNFPLFVLIFPILVLLEHQIKSGYLLYLLLSWIFIYTIIEIKDIISWLTSIYPK